MSRQQFRTFHVFFQFFHVPFQFGPAILEPSDHLGVGQPQTRGYFVSVRRTEVFLVQEPLFQLENLVVCEGRPRFSLLLWLLPRIE